MSKLVYEKTEDSALDYTFEWEDWLAGDTIGSYTLTVPTGITLDDEESTVSTVTIWVSGGTVDNTYLIENEITTVGGRTEKKYIVITIVGFSNIDYLITDLRLHLGDITEASYRYMDEWLSRALLMSIKALGKWWRYKYLIVENTVSRNTYYPFAFSEPPIIETGDERAIILMASLIIKNGDLENNAWNLGSWKDAEIAYSNIEASKTKNSSIERDYNELISILTPPNKRLAKAIKQSLPGYKGNKWETVDYN